MTIEHRVERTQYDSRHHPSDDELIAYSGGTLSEPEHENVQSHLVGCDECLISFKEMRDFFESHRPGEQVDTGEIEVEWKSFWNRLKAEDAMRDHGAEQMRPGRWRYPALSGALAASLLVALASGIWAIMQRQEKQQMARQVEIERESAALLQAERNNWETRTKQLEEEEQVLRERVGQLEHSPSPKLPLINPDLNTPIYDLYSRESVQRSGNDSGVNRIKLPQTSRLVVLILNGEGLAKQPSYSLAILDGTQQIKWKGSGLVRDKNGNLTLILDRAFLTKGVYRVKLYGSGHRSNELAEYLVHVE